jgi:hypothetical protein
MIDRRAFLSCLAGPLLSAAVEPAPAATTTPAAPCRLDIAAPFIALDPSQNLSTSLLFTATCFQGIDGFRKPGFATDYQIELYDHKGREIALDNGGKVEITAMRPTLLDMGKLSGRDAFFGGAKVSVAPSPNQMPRAGDLFSAGFVRWDLPANFDNIHAHPAAPQQMIGKFNYTMPFPALSEYHVAFSLFNPADGECYGSLRVVDRMGRTVAQRDYSLHPHQTQLQTMADLKPADTPGEAWAITPLANAALRDGGTLVIRNDSPTVPFAYVFMKGRTGNSFTAEHPLHFQADVPVKPARATPYGPNRSFPAQAMVYTPMLFKGLQVGDVKLESRLYLSASRWSEEALWMLPFVTTGEGNIAWVSNRDDRSADRIAPAALAVDGAVRLTEFQSCRIDSAALPLPDGFSGGFGAAAIPKTSHSLNKVEVRAFPARRRGCAVVPAGGVPRGAGERLYRLRGAFNTG